MRNVIWITVILNVIWSKDINENDVNRDLNVNVIKEKSMMFLSAVHYVEFDKCSMFNRTYIVNNEQQNLTMLNDSHFKYDNKTFKLIKETLSFEVINSSKFHIQFKADYSNNSYLFNIQHNKTSKDNIHSSNNSYILYNNDSDFIYNEYKYHSFKIQEFIYEKNYIIGNILIFSSIYMLIFGTISNAFSVYFLCICSLCSIIEEILIVKKHYPSVLISFIFLFSIIFGIFIGSFFHFYAKRFKFFILISMSLICIAKTTISSLYTFPHFEILIFIYIILYIISIIFGFIIAYFYGKKINMEIGKYATGKETYYKENPLTKERFFIILPSSIICAFLFTSGLTYENGGVYYWKLFLHKEDIENIYGTTLPKQTTYMYLLIFICFTLISFAIQVLVFHIYSQELPNESFDMLFVDIEQDKDDSINKPFISETNSKHRIRESESDKTQQYNQFTESNDDNENGEYE